MNNFVIFGVGLTVTLIAGMGVLTSMVFIGYKKSETKQKDAAIYVVNKPI